MAMILPDFKRGEDTPWNSSGSPVYCRLVFSESVPLGCKGDPHPCTGSCIWLHSCPDGDGCLPHLCEMVYGPSTVCEADREWSVVSGLKMPVPCTFAWPWIDVKFTSSWTNRVSEWENLRVSFPFILQMRALSPWEVKSLIGSHGSTRCGTWVPWCAWGSRPYARVFHPMPDPHPCSLALPSPPAKKTGSSIFIHLEPNLVMLFQHPWAVLSLEVESLFPMHPTGWDSHS